MSLHKAKLPKLSDKLDATGKVKEELAEELEAIEEVLEVAPKKKKGKN